MNFRIMTKQGKNLWSFLTDEEGFLLEFETRTECAEELLAQAKTVPLGDMAVVKVLDRKELIEIECECPEPEPTPDEPENPDDTDPDNPDDKDPDNGGENNGEQKPEEPPLPDEGNEEGGEIGNDNGNEENEQP